MHTLVAAALQGLVTALAAPTLPKPGWGRPERRMAAAMVPEGAEHDDVEAAKLQARPPWSRACGEPCHFSPACCLY